MGKYDGVLMKESFETIAPQVQVWEDFFFALYKVLKLNAQAVIVGRLEPPTLPLPPALLAAWKEGIPPMETLIHEATECGFDCATETLVYRVEIDKNDYADELKRRRLPFMTEEISDDDIDACLKDLPNPIKAKDTLQLLCLTKVIS